MKHRLRIGLVIHGDNFVKLQEVREKLVQMAHYWNVATDLDVAIATDFYEGGLYDDDKNNFTYK